MRWPGRIPAGRVCSEVTSAIDFLPTFARLAGAEPPSDRVIDGRDIWPLAAGEPGAKSPHRAFFYYRGRALEAVRCGRWKLHVAKGKERRRELYDLSVDVRESVDVAAQHPEVVAELERELAACRQELGDSLEGVEGRGCRPVGRVAEGRPLTEYRQDHPYVVAMYDLADYG
jgi:arylsulfatase A-like enzyme